MAFSLGLPGISRRQAFLLHFTASMAIFLVVAVLMLVFWYPPPLFDINGGWRGMRIMVLVDVVLGPGLTLLLFKPGKPGLKFDMTFVVVVQAVALTWGIWTVYTSRPALMVFADDALNAVTYSRFADSGVSRQEFDQWVGFRPTWVYVDLPEDPIEFDAVLDQAYKGGRPLSLLTDRYRPYSEHLPELYRRGGVDLERYVERNNAWKAEFDRFVRGRGGDVSGLVFIPAFGIYKRVMLAIDRASGDVVASLDITFRAGLAAASR